MAKKEKKEIIIMIIIMIVIIIKTWQVSFHEVRILSLFLLKNDINYMYTSS